MAVRTTENKNNTSGYLGVNWSEEKQKWHAKLGIKYKRIHLGYFDSPEDAHKAYLDAKKKYNLKGKKK